ncbi:MAG: hypothetical protein Q7R85_04385 [bacterium]|nr:hypothetical protein [bacterium]
MDKSADNNFSLKSYWPSFVLAPLLAAFIVQQTYLFFPRVAHADQGVQLVNTKDILYTQIDAGINPSAEATAGKFANDADYLRDSLKCKGWKGNPIDVVRFPDAPPGELTAIDNTRPAVAAELGMDQIPAHVHDASDLLNKKLVKSIGSEIRKVLGENPSRLDALSKIFGTDPNKLRGLRVGEIADRLTSIANRPPTWGDFARVRMVSQSPNLIEANPYGFKETKLAGTSLTPEELASCDACKSLKVPPEKWAELENQTARRLEAEAFGNAPLLDLKEEIIKAHKEIDILQDQLSNTVRAGDEAGAVALRARIKSLQTAVAIEERALADAIVTSVNEFNSWPILYDDIKNKLPEVHELLKKSGETPCPDKPVAPDPCPPGTTPTYQTIPESTDDIIKLYRGLSPDDALADIENLIKVRPEYAKRVAQALQQSLAVERAEIDAQLAALEKSKLPPSQDLLTRNAEVAKASEALDELLPKVEKAVASQTCSAVTAAEEAARATKILAKSESTLAGIIRKWAPDLSPKANYSALGFNKSSVVKGIRATFGPLNVILTLITSAAEVYLKAEEIDKFLDDVESFNTNLGNSIRNIRQAKAKLADAKTNPLCVVEELNQQRDDIVSEIANAFVLAQALDVANAKLVELYDPDFFSKLSWYQKINPLQWLAALEKTDWIGRLRGWSQGFGSETSFTEAVFGLYPEILAVDPRAEGGACTQDEECAPVSLFLFCKEGTPPPPPPTRTTCFQPAAIVDFYPDGPDEADPQILTLRCTADSPSGVVNGAMTVLRRRLSDRPANQYPVVNNSIQGTVSGGYVVCGGPLGASVCVGDGVAPPIPSGAQVGVGGTSGGGFFSAIGNSIKNIFGSSASQAPGSGAGAKGGVGAGGVSGPAGASVGSQETPYSIGISDQVISRVSALSEGSAIPRLKPIGGIQPDIRLDAASGNRVCFAAPMNTEMLQPLIFGATIGFIPRNVTVPLTAEGDACVAVKDLRVGDAIKFRVRRR